MPRKKTTPEPVPPAAAEAAGTSPASPASKSAKAATTKSAAATSTTKKPAAKKAPRAATATRTKGASPGQALQAAPTPPATSVHDLVEQLRRGDLVSRSAAAAALARSGDAKAASALAEALRDPTAELACEAATALGTLADPSTLHALVDVLANRDGYFHASVRAAAATALGGMADPRATDALAAAVRDAAGEASLAAVEALARRGDPLGRAALEDAAWNADGFFLAVVQDAASRALATLPTG